MFPALVALETRCTGKSPCRIRHQVLMKMDETQSCSTLLEDGRIVQGITAGKVLEPSTVQDLEYPAH
jgi:hypothetical protein